MDFCGKSSGLADFENTVNRGSAVIFDTDSGFCLSYVRIFGPKRNLDHRSFFTLSRYVNDSIQIISFFERSSFKLRWEPVIGTVLCFSHHACCLLYIWAQLTVAITFTSFLFTLYTCVIGCGCGFGFEHKFWWIDGFAEKKARISGFVYPYSAPSITHWWGEQINFKS